ncbi:MAG: hypothetical protein R2911_25925 [Caldilineaceae bacterium]
MLITVTICPAPACSCWSAPSSPRSIPKTLARFTGDRARDVSEEARDQVATWLQAAPDGAFKRAQMLDLLTNPHSALDKEEQDWLFGEALPSGLSFAPTA